MSLLRYANKSMHTLLFFILFFTSCLSWQQTILPPVPDLPGNHTWEEAFDVLGISWNPDGTLYRNYTLIPMVNATPCADPKNPPTACSKDITINDISKAYVRVYIPLDPPKNKKLPLIVNLHGGDFVLYTAASVVYHILCEGVAAQVRAVVVSVDYRHAPENRLPAAYYDALNGLSWVQDQAKSIGRRDPWMDYADFSRVFILGSGSGGNIAYHLALRAVDLNLWPLKIEGLLLNQPFFSGVKATESENRLQEDPYVPLYANYVLWWLALPIYANRDHEFCNPISGGTYGGRVLRLPRVYIKGDSGDPLVDRSVILAKFLESYGVNVTKCFNKGGNHGIELTNSTAAQELFDDIKLFVSSNSETKPAGYSYASS